MPTTTAIRRPATETLKVPTLRLLSSGATEAERIAFVRSHLRAIEQCGRRTIQHAWLVGRELCYIREKRADLRGRAWVAFTRKHFDLGETQSFNLMRVSRAFPSLKSIPGGIESVRGAIGHLRAQQEIDQATGQSRAGRRPTASTEASGAEPSGSSHEMKFYCPKALPSSARAREQLRIAQRRLAEIASSDAASFRAVCEVIRQHHTQIRGKARTRATKTR